MSYIPPDEFDKALAKLEARKTSIVPDTDTKYNPEIDGYIGFMNTNTPRYSSKDIESFEKYNTGYSNVIDPYKRRQENQTWKEQALATAYNLPVNILAGLVEGVGYIGTLAETGDDKDYTNAFVEFGKGMRNWGGVGQEVYTNPYEEHDLSDSGFWFNMGGGLVESIASFAALGTGVASVIGKGAGLAAEGLASIGKAKAGVETAAKIAKYIQSTANLTGRGLTAASLAYTEGAMVASEVYKKTQQRAKEELDREVMDGETSSRALAKGFKSNQEYANHIAAESAAVTARINTVLNTALNLTSVGAFFPTLGAGRTFQRALNESLAKIEGKLGRTLSTAERNAAMKALVNKADDTGENIVSKIINENNISLTNKNPNGWIEGYNFLSEGTQEFLEEVVNEVAGKAGERAALDADTEKEGSLVDKYLNAFSQIEAKDAFTKEAFISGVAGFVGGAGNTALMRYVGLKNTPKMETYQAPVLGRTGENGEIGPTGEFTTERRAKMGADGQPEMERKAAYKREQEEQEFLFTQAKNDLANQFAFIERQQNKIKEEKDKGEQADLIKIAGLENELFATVALSRAVRNGSAEFLYNTLEEIANTDNTTDIGAEALKEANKAKDELAQRFKINSYNELVQKQQELKQQLLADPSVNTPQVQQYIQDLETTTQEIASQQEVLAKQIQAQQAAKGTRKFADISTEINKTKNKIKQLQTKLADINANSFNYPPIVNQYVHNLVVKNSIDTDDEVIELQRQSKEFAGKTAAMVKGMTENADSQKLGYLPSAEYKQKANKFMEAVKKGTARWENLNALYNKGEVGDAEFTREMWTQMQLADIYEEQANAYGVGTPEFMEFTKTIEAIGQDVKGTAKDEAGNLIGTSPELRVKLVTLGKNLKPKLAEKYKTPTVEMPAPVKNLMEATKSEDIIDAVKNYYSAEEADDQLYTILDGLIKEDTGKLDIDYQRKMQVAMAANKQKEKALAKIKELQTAEGKQNFIKSKQAEYEKALERAKIEKQKAQEKEMAIKTAEKLAQDQKAAEEARIKAEEAARKKAADDTTATTTTAATTVTPTDTEKITTTPPVVTSTTTTTTTTTTTGAKKVTTTTNSSTPTSTVDLSDKPTLKLAVDNYNENADFESYFINKFNTSTDLEDTPQEAFEYLKLLRDNGANLTSAERKFVERVEKIPEANRNFITAEEYLSLPTTDDEDVELFNNALEALTAIRKELGINKDNSETDTAQALSQDSVEEEASDKHLTILNTLLADLNAEDTPVVAVQMTQLFNSSEYTALQEQEQLNKKEEEKLDKKKLETISDSFKQEIENMVKNAIPIEEANSNDIGVLTLKDLNEQIGNEEYDKYTALYNNFEAQAKFKGTQADGKEFTVYKIDNIASSKVIPIENIKVEDIEEGDILVWSFKDRHKDTQYEQQKFALNHPIGDVTVSNKTGQLVVTVALPEKTVPAATGGTVTYNSISINTANPDYIIYGIRKKVQGQKTYNEAGNTLTIENTKVVGEVTNAEEILAKYLTEDNKWADSKKKYEKFKYPLILQQGTFRIDGGSEYTVSNKMLAMFFTDANAIDQLREHIRTSSKIDKETPLDIVTEKAQTILKQKQDNPDSAMFDFSDKYIDEVYAKFVGGDAKDTLSKKGAIITQLAAIVASPLIFPDTVEKATSVEFDKTTKFTLTTFGLTGQEAVDMLDKYASNPEYNTLAKIKTGNLEFYALPLKRINNGLIVLTREGKLQYYSLKEVSALVLDKETVVKKLDAELAANPTSALIPVNATTNKVANTSEKDRISVSFVNYGKETDTELFKPTVRNFRRNLQLIDLFTYEANKEGSKFNLDTLIVAVEQISALVAPNTHYAALLDFQLNSHSTNPITLKEVLSADSLLNSGHKLRYILQALRTAKSIIGRDISSDDDTIQEEARNFVNNVNTVITAIQNTELYKGTVGKQRKAIKWLNKYDGIKFPWTEYTTEEDADGNITKTEDTVYKHGVFISPPSAFGGWVYVVAHEKRETGQPSVFTKEDGYLAWVSFTDDNKIINYTFAQDVRGIGSAFDENKELLDKTSWKDTDDLLNTHTYIPFETAQIEQFKKGDIVRIVNTVNKSDGTTFETVQLAFFERYIDAKTEGKVVLQLAVKDKDGKKAVITREIGADGINEYPLKNGNISITKVVGKFVPNNTMSSKIKRRNNMLRFLAKVNKPSVRIQRSGLKDVIYPTGLHHYRYSTRMFPTPDVGAAYLHLLGPGDVIVYQDSTGKRYVRPVEKVVNNMLFYDKESGGINAPITFITVLNPDNPAANDIKLASNKFELGPDTGVKPLTFRIKEGSNTHNLEKATGKQVEEYTVVGVFLSPNTQKNRKADLKKTDDVAKKKGEKAKATYAGVVPSTDTADLVSKLAVNNNKPEDNNEQPTENNEVLKETVNTADTPEDYQNAFFYTQGYPDADINNLAKEDGKFLQYITAKYTQQFFDDYTSASEIKDFAATHKMKVLNDDEFEKWFPMYDKRYYTEEILLNGKPKPVVVKLVRITPSGAEEDVMYDGQLVITQLPVEVGTTDTDPKQIAWNKTLEEIKAGKITDFVLHPEFPVKSGTNNWITEPQALTITNWEQEATKNMVSKEPIKLVVQTAGKTAGSQTKTIVALNNGATRYVNHGTVFAIHANKIMVLDKLKLSEISLDNGRLQQGQLVDTAIGLMLLQLNNTKNPTGLLNNYWKRLDSFIYTGITTNKDNKPVYPDNGDKFPVYELAVINADNDHFIYMRGLLNNDATRKKTEQLLAGFKLGTDYIINTNGKNRFIKIPAQKVKNQYVLSEQQVKLLTALLADKEFNVNNSELNNNTQFKLLTLKPNTTLHNIVPTEKDFEEVDTEKSYEDFLKESVLTTNITTAPVKTLSREFIIKPISTAVVADKTVTSTANVDTETTTTNPTGKLKVKPPTKATTTGNNTYSSDFTKYALYEITNEAEYNKQKSVLEEIVNRTIANETLAEDYDAFLEKYKTDIALASMPNAKEKLRKQREIDANNENIEKCNVPF